MDKAKITLLAAADKAQKSNAGYRVVSAYPKLVSDKPVADITLARGGTFKTVTEKLD